MSDFWDRIKNDDKLANARRKLSFHEFRMIATHARESDPSTLANPPAPKPEAVSDDMVERVARALCIEDGRDPDSLDKLFMCDKNDNPLPAWMWWEDHARAVLKLLYPAPETKKVQNDHEI